MESYENFVISAVSYAWNLRPQKQVSEDRSPPWYTGAPTVF